MSGRKTYKEMTCTELMVKAEEWRINRRCEVEVYMTLTKDLRTFRGNGLRCFTLHGNSNIPFEKLSAGERAVLALNYRLIFKTPERSLVLIDTPETSLHVIWQHEFIEDISKIAELLDLDFIVATHSPAIIHNRSDLAVGL